VKILVNHIRFQDRGRFGAMICETNEEFLQGSLLLSVVDDLIFDECIDVRKY